MSIRTIYMILILSARSVQMQAQGEGNIWIFGNHAGLDFNSGVPVPVSSAIETIEGSASVCDPSGNLLFYTEGSTIWDRNGNEMPNGTQLTGLVFQDYSPTASTTQSSLIVPFPGDTNLYYVFSLTDGTILSKHNLYYSVVDMRLNNGLGDVVAGRKGIMLDSTLSEKLTGTTGKCCNIWVVVNQTDGNFHAFEITGAGLNTVPVISPSSINSRFTYNYGEIKFSEDGNLMAAVSQSFFGLILYDFDGYSGKFSNIRPIVRKDLYGVCFSPGGRFLYAAGDSIHQFDITRPTAADIAASVVPVAATGGLTNIKRAPDGKLYFQGRVGLSRIHFPDLAGPLCQVETAAVIPLPGTSVVYGGLSNVVPVLRAETAPFTERDTSVCFRDSILLTAPGPYCRYLWQDGTTEPSYTARASGSYTVQYYTPACVLHRDMIRVNFAAAIPTAGGYNGCGKDSTGYLFVLPGEQDTFPYRYTWHDRDGKELRQKISAIGDTLRELNAGVYTVRMSGNGCDTTIELRLHIPDDITLNFTTDTIICLADTSFFLNTSLGYDRFLWQFGDGDTSTERHASHVYRHPGHYRVSLTGYPCMDTFVRTVIVDSSAYVWFTTGRDEYCLGEEIKIQPHYPPGIREIVWDFGDQITGSSLSPLHAYDRDGDYLIRARAYFRACADTSFTKTVSIHPLPVAALGTDTAICPGGQPLMLSPTGPAGPAYQYLWNTGAKSSEISVSGPGTFSLTVRNEYGCASSDTITIRKSCYIDIPNVFSPNSDGLNDYFFPRDLPGNGLAAFHMRIFNRWGQVIFETKNPAGRGWDGRFNGAEQPEGVYIYLIEAGFINGTEERHQGNLSLIR